MPLGVLHAQQPGPLQLIRVVCAFVIVICSLMVAAEARAAPRAGKVAYVTAGAAYLDAGQKDGLVAGAKIDIVRRKRTLSSCEVTGLAEHHAVCLTTRAEPGDRFTFTPAAVAAAAEAPPRKPQPPTSKALEPLKAKVESATIEKVAFKKPVGAVTPRWSLRGSATLRQQVWFASNVDGVFARPSLDASVRTGIGLLSGLFAAATVRVQGDALAPATLRFRPDEAVELFVWDASVGIDEGTIVGAVGRFRPRRAPGMVLLDGAQAGVRTLGGSLEIGGYAGAVPDLVTIAPSLDRVAAGAYAALDLPAFEGMLFSPRARLGVMSSPDLALVRAELEAQALFSWSDLASVGASARVGVGGADASASVPSLDAARVDVDVEPWQALRVHGGYRWLAPLVVDFDAKAALVPPVIGVHHGDLGATWQVADWFSLGGLGGVGVDSDGAVARGYVGPQLGLPLAFGPLGGVELAYLEELGTFGGRSAYVSSVLTPWSALSVYVRASYYENDALGDPLREGALATMLEAPVLPWLSFRGRAQVQQSFAPADGSLRAEPSLLLVDLAVAGSI